MKTFLNKTWIVIKYFLMSITLLIWVILTAVELLLWLFEKVFKILAYLVHKLAELIELPFKIKVMKISIPKYVAVLDVADIPKELLNNMQRVLLVKYLVYLIKRDMISQTDRLEDVIIRWKSTGKSTEELEGFAKYLDMNTSGVDEILLLLSRWYIVDKHGIPDDIKIKLAQLCTEGECITHASSLQDIFLKYETIDATITSGKLLNRFDITTLHELDVEYLRTLDSKLFA